MTADPAQRASSSLKLLWIGPVLFIAVAIAYRLTLESWFVRDDLMLLEQAAGHLSDPWRIFADRSNGYFRPLANLLFSIQWALFGDAASGYYWVNFVLHAWVGAWLSVLAAELFRAGRSPAWTIGLISGVVFALLSRPSATVYWISGQTTLLAPAAMLPTLWGYARLRRARPGGVPVRSDLLILAGVLLTLSSNEIGIVIFPLLVWVELLVSGVQSARRSGFWIRTGVLVALGGAYVLSQLSVFTDASNRGTASAEHTLLSWIGSLPAIVAFSLQPSPDTSSPTDPRLGGFLLAVLLLIPLLTRRDGWRVSLFGLLALLSCLLPFATLLANAKDPGKLISDRYVYLPSIAVALIVGAGLGSLLIRIAPSKLRLPIALLAACSFAGVQARALTERIPSERLFHQIGRSSQTFIEALETELASTPGAPHSWVVVGGPFVNQKHASAAYRLLLELPAEAVALESIDLDPSGRPMGITGRIAPYLLDRYGTEELLVFDHENERLIVGTDREAILRRELVYSWRRPRQRSARAWIAVLRRN